jgi:hypothetical protein
LEGGRTISSGKLTTVPGVQIYKDREQVSYIGFGEKKKKKEKKTEIGELSYMNEKKSNHDCKVLQVQNWSDRRTLSK